MSDTILLMGKKENIYYSGDLKVLYMNLMFSILVSEFFYLGFSSLNFSGTDREVSKRQMVRKEG